MDDSTGTMLVRDDPLAKEEHKTSAMSHTLEGYCATNNNVWGNVTGGRVRLRSCCRKQSRVPQRETKKAAEDYHLIHLCVHNRPEE